ncbi:hypothetical protein VTJ04DRAFT_2919 [Mycothermus thermophilus]|uniref:uncharacterized protein n=1 Tax=Humicola insolens TaxID=85995 RepID=UPI003743B0DD
MSDDQQDAGSTSAAPAAAHQQQQQLPRPVPSASASASAAGTAAAQPRRSSSAGSSNNNNNDDNSSSSSSDDEDSPSQQRTRRHRQALAKKLEYITHLQKSLDMLVVAYICVLYSMETSILRLLLRLLPHFSFLTPKDSLLPPPLLFPTAAADQGPVYTMFTPTLLCVLTHLFFSLPQAGEASRGYLHGGVIIDFIGQRPPRSRLAFLLLDLVILGLQCLMLAVKRERDGLRRLVLPSLGTARSGSGSGSSNTGEQTGTASTTQDHDAEERGVRRDEEDGGIEMQPLSAADVGGRGRHGGGGGGDDGDDNNNDDDGGDDGTYASAAASADPLDLIRSGNAVLANFHVAHAVRMGSAVAGAAGAASSPLQTVRYGATLAARAAQRRARLMRTRQQR